MVLPESHVLIQHYELRSFCISLYHTFVNIPALISKRRVFLSSRARIFTKVWYKDMKNNFGFQSFSMWPFYFQKKVNNSKKVKNIRTYHIIMVFENKNNHSKICRFVLIDERVSQNCVGFSKMSSALSL